MYKYYKLSGKINRRSPRNELADDEVYLRENLLCRDGRLTRCKGTHRVIQDLTGIPTWSGRYHTIETGAISPKTFVYTQDGVIWLLDDLHNKAEVVKTGLNTNAYPRHWLWKSETQTKMFLVDGRDLYEYDGNNDNLFVKVDIEDADGNPIYPIDLIEHKDRLCLISTAFLYISKNLDPRTYNDSTDSIQIIIGSGKGTNEAIRKIADKLYTLNTEGIFVLNGDELSAVASTFEIDLVDDAHRIIAGRTAVRVENAINFLADDLNIWSFNGSTCSKLTHSEKLEDFIFNHKDYLDKAVATYYNNYYMLSFVENAYTYNNLEFWWDALENKGDFVRGRNVACYMEYDPTIEPIKQQIGRSDEGSIMDTDDGMNFGEQPIKALLWTKDYTPQKGLNVRFQRFFFEIEPIGDRNITIGYMLDGRLAPDAWWTQNLQGDTTGLGFIKIKNQTQTMYAIRPQIANSNGTSISFYLNDNTLNLNTIIYGIGLEYTPKYAKKGRIVGR